MLSPAQLQLAPYNSRKTFDDEYIGELAQSLKAQGLLQAILVRPLTPAKGKKLATYEVVIGACRTKAAQLAGLEKIPCSVAELTDDQAFEANVTENLQRKDISAMEEARAFTAMLDRGYTLQQLGERFGKSHVYIWNRVQLAKATPELQAAIEAGSIPLTYARELAKFPEHIQVQEVKDFGWRFQRDPKAWYEKLIDHYGIDLTSAPFDTSFFGCLNCPFEGRALGLTKEPAFVCFNKAKYLEHAKSHILIMLDRDPKLKLVAYRHQHDDAMKLWVDDLPENRVILKLGWNEAYDDVHAPEMPECEEPDEEDYDTPGEYQVAVEDAKALHREEMVEYIKSMDEYSKKMEKGVRGIFMVGKRIGEIVLLEETKSAKAHQAREMALLDGDDRGAEKRAIIEEISKLKEKAHRFPSLGEEKAYEAAINQTNELAIYKGIDSTDAQPALIAEELDALYLMLLNRFDHHLPRNLKVALFGKDGWFNKDDKSIKKALLLKEQLLPLLIRKLLMADFQPADGKGTTELQRYAWDKIAWALEDVDYNPVADARSNYAQKQKKANARIADLQSALERLEKEVAQ